MAEKVVFHRQQPVVCAVFSIERVQESPKLAVGGNADRNHIVPDRCLSPVGAAGFRFVPFFQEVAGQADPVFQLRKSVIPVGWRQRTSGEDIEFVPQIDERAAQPAAAFFLPRRDRVDHAGRLSRREQAQIRQIGGVARNAHRNDGHILHVVRMGQQVMVRPIQDGAVVPAGAADNLGMDMDSGREETLQFSISPLDWRLIIIRSRTAGSVACTET